MKGFHKYRRDHEIKIVIVYHLVASDVAIFVCRLLNLIKKRFLFITKNTVINKNLVPLLGIFRGISHAIGYDLIKQN